MTVGRTSARVVQRLTLSIFSSEWVRIPLAPTGSLTSTELGTLDGRVESGTGMTLVARGRGRHQVRVDSVVSLRADESAARATRTAEIALPEAGAVTGAVLTGEEIEEVSFVSGGSRAPRPCAPVRVRGRAGCHARHSPVGQGPPSRAGAAFPLKYEAVSSALAEGLARTRTRISATAGVRGRERPGRDLRGRAAEGFRGGLGPAS